MNIEEFVNSYLQEHRHDILLNPYNGLIDFANTFKEQMLKDAKDGYVSAIIIHNDGDEEHYAVTYPNGERPHSITDKVKVIVLKEEE